MKAVAPRRPADEIGQAKWAALRIIPLRHILSYRKIAAPSNATSSDACDGRNAGRYPLAAHFVGTVRVEWLTETGADRKMRLLESFGFVDENALDWTIPSGAAIDGASIPRIFWTSFGPPFVGDYRRASVVHDHYCDVRTRPSADVHRMFRSACIAGGVATSIAGQMYLAVKLFGPSWTSDPSILSGRSLDTWATRRTDTLAVPLATTATVDDYFDMAKIIETTDPSVAEIDRMIAARTRMVPLIPLAEPLL